MPEPAGHQGPTPNRRSASGVHMSREEFENTVGEALDLVPSRLMAHLDNVVFLVEDTPEHGDLLGLYEGVPITQRSEFGGAWLPDRITLYRLPILRMCRTTEEVRHEVAVTVVHEIAHHFGIADDRLHELGWG